MEEDDKSTLMLVSSKIDDLTKIISEHVLKDDKFQRALQSSIDGSDDYPGLRGRIDRIEQVNNTTLRFFWIVFGSIICLLS